MRKCDSVLKKAEIFSASTVIDTTSEYKAKNLSILISRYSALRSKEMEQWHVGVDYETQRFNPIPVD